MRTIEVKAAAVTVSVVVPWMEPSVAVIVDEPVASVEARPALEMVAATVFDEAHVTRSVKFSVVPSVNVPVAVNGSVNPLAMLGFDGVTAIELTTAAVTDNVVLPLKLPTDAEMVDEPMPRAEARPPLEMVATAVFDEAHVATPVRFSVVPSVNVPVAVNGSVNPLATPGFDGVTAIEVITAGVTVSVVDPIWLPDVAMMVDEPSASDEARPPVEMPATAVFDDVHVTEFVRLDVVPSVYVPVATNASVRPLAMLGSTGVTVIEVSAAARTVSAVVPVMLPEVALIVVLPAVTAVARPVASIVATPVFDEAQAADAVRLAVVPSV